MRQTSKNHLHGLLAISLLLILPGEQAAGRDPISVSVQRLDELTVDTEYSAPAMVVAANHSILHAQVTAVVTEIHADVGATVSSNDLLVVLDDADALQGLTRMKAELAAVEAQLRLAEFRLRKAQDLLTQDFVSDEELLARETELAVLRAQHQTATANYDTAQLNVARTKIRAPFNGAVVERLAQVGSLAAPGSPLVILTQLDKAEVDAELSPEFAARIAPGTTVFFRSRGMSWNVSLDRLSHVIEANSRIQRARFKMTDAAAPIGASGEIYWRSSGQQIPADFIQQRGSLLGIFISDGERASFVELAGAQAGRPAATSLPPETLIVVDGRARLQDGDELVISRK